MMLKIVLLVIFVAMVMRYVYWKRRCRSVEGAIKDAEVKTGAFSEERVADAEFRDIADKEAR